MSLDNISPPRLAVLIDAENMPSKYAEAIFEEVAKFGEASVRRLYGDIDEGSVRPWLDKTAGLAIAVLHQPKNTSGKNASDIALVIDAMDLLGARHLQGFVIVSSDGDFTKLAQRIREQGVDVWGIGNSHTPKSFRMACKTFIEVENLDDSAPAKAIAASVGRKNVNHAFQLISNIASDSNEASGWATLAWIGAQLNQRYPDFDSRSYGHKRLSDLVTEIDKFEIRKDGNGILIRQKGSND